MADPRVMAPLVLLAALAAGCFAPGAPTLTAEVGSLPGAPAPPGNGTFWLVSASGVQGHPTGTACDRGFTHSVYEEIRAVEVDSDAYPYDPALVWALLSVQVDTPGACPVVDVLKANAPLEPWEGVLGGLRVRIDLGTGLAHVEAGPSSWDLAPGQVLQLQKARGEPLDLRVANHGSWPTAGLHVTPDASYP